ncbi:MAG TPA: hypothetical protein VMX54_02700 [Vicinamibacteria bacterium]|nr:hypothetical protein [Vicinamibacteria bacterium]
MRKSVVVGGLGLALLAAAFAAAQTTNTAWLHVRVDEAQKASKVRVNLPMTVIDAVLKATPELIEEHGKVNLGDHHGMKLADCRRAWKQLMAAGDAEFVTVESEDENVRVQRKGDLVIVYADHKGHPARPAKAEAEAGKAETAAKDKGPGEVRVEVPVSLVDALLSGEGEEVNLQAALAEVQKRRGDIVRVHDTDADVRIWIDEQNSPGPSTR